jgi:phosphatidylglycerol:prolipoprotein diacylglycerol transferase
MEVGIDPVAFTVGSVEIRWYGIMVALAVVAGVLVAAWMARREGIGDINQNQVLSMAPWAIIGGIIGARLIHVFDNWGDFWASPSEIIGGAGLGVFGAILGGTVAGVIYAKIKGFPIGRLADMCAFGLISAQAIGRVGCFLNGCCYGTATDLTWGTMWTHPDSEGYSGTFLLGIWVHPTQLYEIILDVFILATIWFLLHRLRVPGAIFLIYLSLYSIGRFTISFWRENEEAFLGLQQAQVVSLVVLAVAVGLLIYIYRRGPAEPGEMAYIDNTAS